jgi:hypothetical protein
MVELYILLRPATDGFGALFRFRPIILIWFLGVVCKIILTQQNRK